MLTTGSLVESAGLCKLNLGNLTMGNFTLDKVIFILGNFTLVDSIPDNPTKGNIIPS